MIYINKIVCIVYNRCRKIVLLFIGFVGNRIILFKMLNNKLQKCTKAFNIGELNQTRTTYTEFNAKARTVCYLRSREEILHLTYM